MPTISRLRALKGCALFFAFVSTTGGALAQQAHTERVFDQGMDNPFPWTFYDWKPGSNKAGCASGGAMVGISGGFPQFAPHSILCRTPTSSAFTFHQENPPSAYHENSEQVYFGNSADYGHHPVGGNVDWDPGFLKAECPSGRFVVGVSQQNPSRELDAVWCSETNTTANVSSQSCHVEAFPGNHEWPTYTSPQDWSPGFDKLTCKANEVVVGISTNASNHFVHGMLCCGLRTSPWSKVTTQFPGTQPLHIQLLMDGSVLVQDGGGNMSRWRRYFPDAQGHYKNGTWGPSFSSSLGRGYFASGMMKSGKYFIAGGEYVFDPISGAIPCDSTSCVNHNKCEILDPLGNSGIGQWSTNCPDMPFVADIGDGVAAPLGDSSGKLLVGAIGRNQDGMTFDPSKIGTGTNPWAAVPTLPTGSVSFSIIYQEGSLALRQDGKILLAGEGVSLFTPSSGNGTWSTIFPAPPKDPFSRNTTTMTYGATEGGSALTLYDGRVLILGATGSNAIFPKDPPPAGTALVNVADTPIFDPDNRLDPSVATHIMNMSERGHAVMPNGKVLCAAGKVDPLKLGTGEIGGAIYEYDPAADRFTDVSTGGPSSIFAGSIVRQTPLPDGTVMVAGESTKDIFIYTPPDPPMTNNRPSISNVTYVGGSSFNLDGTGLNGLTNGANQDDEGQNYTSFPVVSVSWGTNRKYCTISNLSTMSIAPGVRVSLTFKVPSSVPHNTSLEVRVSASGQQSTSRTVFYP